MQSKKVNIPSYIEDPTYRYQRPGLKLKVESQGNGVKTKIMNLREVAEGLGVPTEYPLKFLSLRFGSQPIFKEKGNEITAILKGSFTNEEMTKALDILVEKFLLCPKCTYPELIIHVKKKLVYGRCECCGKTFELDNAHEFAAYIVKHPPPIKEKVQPLPKKDDEGKVEPGNQTAAEEKKEEEDAEEKLPEYPLAALEDKIDEVKRLYSQQNLESYEGKKDEIKSIVELVNSYQMKAHLKSFIFFQAIFSTNFVKDVQKNKDLIVGMQEVLKLPFEELDLLMNLEYALYETHKSQALEKFIPTILHAFYEHDLLDEEFLLEWDGNAYLMNMKSDSRFKMEHDKQLKEAAKEMIIWLRTA
jgi:translation initiation factor 2 beta subunit (eIF-2beta)/eIF-5